MALVGAAVSLTAVPLLLYWEVGRPLDCANLSLGERPELVLVLEQFLD